MELFTILLIGFSLAMDAFSVSVGYGVCFKRCEMAAALRIALSTALFQALMPLGGWFLGNMLGKFISTISPYIAFFLLLFIGIKMFIEALKSGEECSIEDISRGKRLIAISIATSIDAFAAGFGLGLLNFPLILSISIIGLITFIMSFLGVYLGKWLGSILGKISEFAGSIILIGIGFKILIQAIL